MGVKLTLKLNSAQLDLELGNLGELSTNQAVLEVTIRLSQVEPREMGWHTSVAPSQTELGTAKSQLVSPINDHPITVLNTKIQVLPSVIRMYSVCNYYSLTYVLLTI